MKGNELVLFELNNLDIYELTDEQIEIIVDNLLKSINIKKLEEQIHKVTLKLAQVGSPKFGAKIQPLLDEDEDRLRLIYLLNHNLDIFKANFKVLKANKYGCRDDGEKVFGFLSNTKDIVETIYKYGEFTIKQKEEQAKELAKAQEEWLLFMQEKERRNLGGGSND